MSKWEHLGSIAEGAYGVVAKCKHKETGELVAIKRFKEREEDLDEATRRVVLREIKLLKALKHENIIEMKEAFRKKGTLHLVFELFGRSMLDVIEAHPNGLEAEKVRTVISQVARALEYCHRRGVIHRDLKPENVLIDSSDFSVRLCDFGCARPVPTEAGVELTDYVATRWYRPPELLLSYTDYGTAVDMWALGCIAGELTDGRALFAGESDLDQLCVIQKVLGPLTAHQQQRSMELSSMQGMTFPDVSNPETLQKRYGDKMSGAMAAFMEGTLRMDPAARLTAKAALKLQWLDAATLPASLKPLREARAPEKPRRQHNSRPPKAAAVAGGELAASGGLPPALPSKLAKQRWGATEDSLPGSWQETPRQWLNSEDSPRALVLPGVPPVSGASAFGQFAGGGSLAMGLPAIGSAQKPPRRALDADFPTLTPLRRSNSREHPRGSAMPPVGGSQASQRSRSATPDSAMLMSGPQNLAAARYRKPGSLPMEPSYTPELVAPDLPGGNFWGFVGGATPLKKNSLSGTGRLLLRAEGGAAASGLEAATFVDAAIRGGQAGGADGATKLRLGGRSSRWTGA